METTDIVKTLVCPIWGLTSWCSKRTDKKNTLYGAAAPPTDALPTGAAYVGLVIVTVLLFIPAILTLCGIIKAFMCGSNKTNLGASGFIWGFLGLFIPLPAIIYLFAGHCEGV